MLEDKLTNPKGINARDIEGSYAQDKIQKLIRLQGAKIKKLIELLCKDIKIWTTLCNNRIHSLCIMELCKAKGASSKIIESLIERVRIGALKVVEVDLEEPSRSKVKDIANIKAKTPLPNRPLR